MKIGYYPGCTLKTKASNLEKPAVSAMKELGVELVELDRWNCCGAVYSLSDDDLVHILAPVRDLIRAQEQGFDRVVVLCSMCYNTLARANLLMRNDPEKRDAINNFMEEEADYAGEVEVLHLLNFLRDEIGWERLRQAVKKPLNGLKLAPYYGCTLTRPKEVTIDPAVSPVVFRDFIQALGGEYVEYPAASECCGSYQMISNPEAGARSAVTVLESAESHGAEALALSCPLCEYNLARRQPDVLKVRERLQPLPVFYFTQLLAVALGLDSKDCDFRMNSGAPEKLLQEKGLLAQV